MRFVITRREALHLADGINSFIFGLSQALIARGHDVSLISPTSSSIPRIREYFGPSQEAKIYSLSEAESPSHLDMVRAWLRKGLPLLHEIAPDFIVVNGALPFRLPFPSCTVSHDLEKRWSYGSTVRRMYKFYAYRQSDSIVATCAELRRALASEIAVAEERIAVIPTCVELAAFQALRLDEREAAILHVGTARYKNPLATMRALARLTRPAKLYITGRPTAEMLEFAAGLPAALRAKIDFVGILSAPDLRRLLARVRLVSVPSLYSAPVASPTVLEALASGTPVVGSPCISGDVLDDSCGFRVEPEDTDRMAAVFDTLLFDDAAWGRGSEGARNQATKFDNTAVAMKYEGLAAYHLRH